MTLSDDDVRDATELAAYLGMMGNRANRRRYAAAVAKVARRNVRTAKIKAGRARAKGAK
jgi:hypothetical protein